MSKWTFLVENRNDGTGWWAVQKYNKTIGRQQNFSDKELAQSCINRWRAFIEGKVEQSPVKVFTKQEIAEFYGKNAVKKRGRPKNEKNFTTSLV